MCPEDRVAGDVSCGALAAWERIFRYFASRGVDQKAFRHEFENDGLFAD